MDVFVCVCNHEVEARRDHPPPPTPTPHPICCTSQSNAPFDNVFPFRPMTRSLCKGFDKQLLIPFAVGAVVFVFGSLCLRVSAGNPNGFSESTPAICPNVFSTGWLVVWLVGLLVGWLVVRSVGRSVAWLVGWLVGRSVGRLVVLLVGWSVGWLVGWSVGWLVGWSVGRLDGWSPHWSFILFRLHI